MGLLFFQDRPSAPTHGQYSYRTARTEGYQFSLDWRPSRRGIAELASETHRDMIGPSNGHGDRTTQRRREQHSGPAATITPTALAVHQSPLDDTQPDSNAAGSKTIFQRGDLLPKTSTSLYELLRL